MPADPSSSRDIPAAAHITAQSLLAPTVKAWRYYLEDQNVSRYTVKAFMSDLQLLVTYLPPDRSIGAITTSELNNFLDWLQTGRGVPCSPKSLARRITSLKAFFRWLNQFGVVLIDPAEKIPQRSVISPTPEVLTPEETQAVLEAACCWPPVSKKVNAWRSAPTTSSWRHPVDRCCSCVTPVRKIAIKNVISNCPPSGKKLTRNIATNTKSTSACSPGRRAG
jgi:hypothetical protein